MPDQQQLASRDTNPQSFYQRLLGLSKSELASDQDELKRALESERALNVLDSEEAYRGQPERLRIAGVLQSLSLNEAPNARQVLVDLTTNSVFLGHRARVSLLIQALANVRPSPPAAIRFWEEHCQPDDGYSNLSIQSVIKNGSSEALSVFEKRIADERFADDRRDWLLFDVLTHRNDLPLLQSSERLLSGNLKEDLRATLIDVLFDYRPDEWFGPHVIPVPPPREAAPVAALQKLNNIGTSLLGTAAGISQRRRQRISAVLAEIRPRLETR